jgi:hypothetical protein
MFPTEDMYHEHNECVIEGGGGNNNNTQNVLPSSSDPESKIPDAASLQDLTVSLTRGAGAKAHCSGHDSVVGGGRKDGSTAASSLQRNGRAGLFGILASQSLCDIVFLEECMMAGHVGIVIDVLLLLSHGLEWVGHDVEDFWPGFCCLPYRTFYYLVVPLSILAVLLGTIMLSLSITTL